MVNDYVMSPKEVCLLSHKHILGVGERKFRWEYPEGSSMSEILPASLSPRTFKIFMPVVKSPVRVSTPLRYVREGECVSVCVCVLVNNNMNDEDYTLMSLLR